MTVTVTVGAAAPPATPASPPGMPPWVMGTMRRLVGGTNPRRGAAVAAGSGGGVVDATTAGAAGGTTMTGSDEADGGGVTADGGGAAGASVGEGGGGGGTSDVVVLGGSSGRRREDLSSMVVSGDGAGGGGGGGDGAGGLGEEDDVVEVVVVETSPTVSTAVAVTVGCTVCVTTPAGTKLEAPSAATGMTTEEDATAAADDDAATEDEAATSAMPRTRLAIAPSKQSTSTPSVLFMGRAKHAVPVGQLTMAKTPLPQMPTSPPTHATWPGLQADCSVSEAKMELKARAAARLLAKTSEGTVVVADGSEVMAVGTSLTGAPVAETTAGGLLLDEEVVVVEEKLVDASGVEGGETLGEAGGDVANASRLDDVESEEETGDVTKAARVEDDAGGLAAGVSADAPAGGGITRKPEGGAVEVEAAGLELEDGVTSPAPLLSGLEDDAKTLCAGLEVLREAETVGATVSAAAGGGVSGVAELLGKSAADERECRCFLDEVDSSAPGWPMGTTARPTLVVVVDGGVAEADVRAAASSELVGVSATRDGGGGGVEEVVLEKSRRNRLLAG